MRADERGVALIMVTAVIAILTAVTVEFTYRERVNMRLATNARDELRAYYLARSSVNLARLLLSFQTQLDNMQIPGLSELLALAGGAPPDPAAGGQAVQSLGIRLWDLVPVDCGLVQMFVAMSAGEDPEPEQGAPDLMLTPFGDFDGGCSAQITDEDSRINVNHLNSLGSKTKTALLQMMAAMQDPRYDFLFDAENRHGIRLNRPETLVSIRDFIDPGQTTANLLVDEEGFPEFVEGAGDEGYNYTRFEPEYKPKNAPLDSYEELYLVAGIGDYFMSAFGDRLTVYTDKNAKLNVTPKDLGDLCMKMVIAARDPVQASVNCADPALMTALWEQIQLQRAALPWIGMQPQAFRALLEGAGIAVNPYIWSGPNAVFGATSRTFTITATGSVGNVEKTIIAVVRMEQGEPMGRLLHWQEK